ncbi:hypothetical protein FDE98_14305 [Clostridium sporogenes]|uniref:Uncharacterized protein n=1 Tax=Clostridium sporogenes TaxID=1509 RepID=A0A7X5PED0_CLOSG|nr:hypothetical protein [Clostridium sporogenes]AJD29127.1 hypothetical protein T258_4107 [Clostridium botulinum Prevot_594]NFL98052.1 hypothetical protein [Clostridium botulinum]NFP55283.1 hypothetical protein [Clostridium botulinum]NFQ17309.1 hypothetical protein [Clostridium sporogenes]NFQ20874.1 hypothetical protein [Clostridium sporogenes]
MRFTKKEKDIITSFDYQIFNNGIEDIYYNHYYRSMFDYFDILEKEGSEISIKVSKMIKRAFILIIDLDRYSEYGDNPIFGMTQTIKEWKNELDLIEKKYWSISEEFLIKFDIKKVKDSLKPCYDY